MILIIGNCAHVLWKTIIGVITARDNKRNRCSQAKSVMMERVNVQRLELFILMWQFGQAFECSSDWLAWGVDPVPCFDAFVQAIFDFRFLTLMAVVGSLAGSLLCFLKVTLHLESFLLQKIYFHVTYNLRIWSEAFLTGYLSIMSRGNGSLSRVNYTTLISLRMEGGCQVG